MLVLFVAWISSRAGLRRREVCRRLGLSCSRYYRWQRRFRSGTDLTDCHRGGESVHPDRPLRWEADAVIDFALAHTQDGYRRLTWAMVDRDVAHLSESAVYRILSEHGLLYRWAAAVRHSGQGPPPVTAPNQRWHTDIMHLRIGQVWYFLVSFLDAYSRYIVHWELLTQMTADEVTLAQLAALEKHPEAKPEIVSDRGCQYTSREYKALIRRFELQHIYCRVAHPQSNGLIERWHRTTRDALCETRPQTYVRAKDAIAGWVEEYNERRLHAALCYIEPAEYFRGDPQERLRLRKQKLAAARQVRRAENQEAAETLIGASPNPAELPTAVGSTPTSLARCAAHSRGAAVYG